jgi:uncharacterized repeat protein (TIGR03803 family)
VGTLFSLTTNGVFNVIHDMDRAVDGANPVAGLIQAGDGGFYGTALQGGPAGAGSVFRVGTDGIFATLYAFTTPGDSSDPLAGLVQGSDGNLYGTSYGGGTSGWGTVFELFNAAAGPVITSQPESQTGTLGGSATFTVGAVGPEPLSYQWFVNSLRTAGSTNATLTVTGLDGSQAGAYTVVVANFGGSVTSAPAQLFYFGAVSAPVGSISPLIITIGALLGEHFLIEASSDLSNPNGWTVLTNITMTANAISFPDPSGVLPATRFYRAVPQP